jgi:hypothetical protein
VDALDRAIATHRRAITTHLRAAEVQPISHDEPAAQTEPPARHKGPTPSARKRYSSKGGSKTPKPSVGFEQQARSEPASSTSVTSEASC